MLNIQDSTSWSSAAPPQGAQTTQDTLERRISGDTLPAVQWVPRTAPKAARFCPHCGEPLGYATPPGWWQPSQPSINWC